MNSNAPGQLFGYVLQLPRALFRLLQAKEGDVISVEHLGDVASVGADGKILTEEDKSSLNSNPVTDRSSNLWKTFANWIKSVQSGELDIAKTNFVLYINNAGKTAIVHSFSIAKNNTEASKAIASAKEILFDLPKSHVAWEHYNFSVNENEKLLENIIQRFELEEGSVTGLSEVRDELKRKIIPDLQLDYMTENLLGWLSREVMSKIADKKPAVISQEQFQKKFLVLIERVRTQELIDVATTSPPQAGDISDQVNSQSLYLQQLDAIEASNEDILDAVTDYLRASVNRGHWIEAGIIDEDVAQEFEASLGEFWKNKKKEIELTQSSESEQKKGELLLLKCKMKNQTIRNMSPPHSTVSGTYHAMANEPSIGWHPDWENLFLNKKA